MISGRGTLRLSHTAEGEDDIVLISRLRRMAGRPQSALREASVHDAEWALERSGRSCILDLRNFLAEARHPGSGSVDRMDDHQVLETVRIGLRTGWLVALHKGLANPASSNATQDLRRLVAQVEKQSRGKLVHRGRHFKLVAADDLAKLPGRNSFEVVPQAAARQVLDGIAAEQPPCADVLSKAKEALSKDWRVPFSSPDGLVLMRRLPSHASSAVDEVALTPSQMKALVERETPDLELDFDTDVEEDLELDFDTDAEEDLALEFGTSPKGDEEEAAGDDGGASDESDVDEEPDDDDDQRSDENDSDTEEPEDAEDLASEDDTEVGENVDSDSEDTSDADADSDAEDSDVSDADDTDDPGSASEGDRSDT